MIRLTALPRSRQIALRELHAAWRASPPDLRRDERGAPLSFDEWAQLTLDFHLRPTMIHLVVRQAHPEVFRG